MHRWALPGSLSSWVFEDLGSSAPADVDEVATLVELLGRSMPRGSTAKLADIAAGRRPSGDDPALVVEGWRTNPELAWTCWGVSTVTAALINVAGRLHATVHGVRRIGDDAPPVDFHSVVVVDDGSDRWVCDPHFGVGPVPRSGGQRERPLVRGELVDHGDRYEWTVHSPVFSRPALRYRSLTGPLDPDDVRAFCDVSVTHTGVGARPYAMVLLADGVATARAEDFDSEAEVRIWRDRFTRLELRDWGEACAALRAAGEHDVREAPSP